MIPEPNLPMGYAIFCDDVRTEQSGKETLIGTYNGDMIVVGKAPATVLQLSFFIRCYDDPQTFPKKITFKVLRSTADATDTIAETQLDVTELPASVLGEDEFAGRPKIVTIGLTMKAENLEFAEECRLRVIAQLGDLELWLGAMQVKIQELPEGVPAVH